MTRLFRLGMAQINSTVGDLGGNMEKICRTIVKAEKMMVDLLVFPEMALTGYPPEDLLLKPQFVKDTQTYLEKTGECTKRKEVTVVVGFVHQEKNNLYNAAALIHRGKIRGIYHKVFLPNYGVFDEKRYFQAGSECPVFVVAGIVVGVSICEDIWYPAGPPSIQALKGGAKLLVSLNASPYHASKGRFREKMLAKRAVDNRAFVAYVNLIGGQDELIFDGHSLLFNPQGKLIATGEQFKEDLILADLDVKEVVEKKRSGDQEEIAFGGLSERVVEIAVSSGKKPSSKKPLLIPRKVETLKATHEIYQALVLGVSDYLQKNGFKKAVIGLSGGIDSALTAAIAVDALGKENVITVFMPSQYSSKTSKEDAEKVAKNLRVKFLVLSIEEIFPVYLRMLKSFFEGLSSDVTEENLQARIRGNILMALSNKFRWLVLSTGNKSEMSVGYATLYGDMSGGFAVLKDVPKTLVYRLAKHKNKMAGREVIPKSILEKAPSAELKPDQRDTDTLPPYEVLDFILQAYVEENKSVQEITALGYSEDLVKRVIKMVDQSEYKRRQAPPGIKITVRAFGKDWRVPITNWYQEQ